MDSDTCSDDNDIDYNEDNDCQEDGDHDDDNDSDKQFMSFNKPTSPSEGTCHTLTTKLHRQLSQPDCDRIPITRLHHFVCTSYEIIAPPFLESNPSCAKQTSMLSKLLQHTFTEAYSKELTNLFAKEVTDQDRRFAWAIISNLVQLVASEVTVSIGTETDDQQKYVQDLDTHGVGAGKLRYIGGFVVGKLKYRTKTIMSNSLLDFHKVAVRRRHTRFTLLKSLISSQAELDETSQYPNTLTENRERQTGILTHITDDVYELFTMMEKERLKNHTVQNLSTSKSSLDSNPVSAILSSGDIHSKWMNAMSNVNTPNMVRPTPLPKLPEPMYVARRFFRQVLLGIMLRAVEISTLKTDLAILFLKSGNKTFTKDVKRMLHVEKSAAHRKQIEDRKRKAAKETSSTTRQAKKAYKVKNTQLEENETEEDGCCPMCAIPFNSIGIQWIQCDSCELWVCKSCSALSQKMFESASSETWVCHNCSPFCHSCEVDLTPKLYSLACDGCSNWFCHECTKLSIAQWKKELTNHWLCVNCDDALINSV